MGKIFFGIKLFYRRWLIFSTVSIHCNKAHKSFPKEINWDEWTNDLFQLWSRSRLGLESFIKLLRCFDRFDADLHISNFRVRNVLIKCVYFLGRNNLSSGQSRTRRLTHQVNSRLRPDFPIPYMKYYRKSQNSVGKSEFSQPRRCSCWRVTVAWKFLISPSY